MKIVSWNLNGLRSVHKKGYWKEFLNRFESDIYLVQETKARPEQLPDELKNPDGYKAFFNYPEHKRGYAGVAIYIKDNLCKNSYKIIYDFGPDDFDTQGRLLGVDFADLVLLNVYFPNGGMGPEALEYKLEFYDYFLDFVLGLKENGKSVIIGGDFNVAHTEKDLARPKENENSVGFLPEEREWLDNLLSNGFIDTWREKNPEKIQYTWWSQRTRARERNIGWRIDYFIASAEIFGKIKKVAIHDDFVGSDHCPLSLELDYECNT